jgi:hypothetical protein
MKKAALAIIGLLQLANAMATPARQFDITLDGFIKAASIYADTPLASYRNLNLTAPTHALPADLIREEGSRLTFQTQQSRFGIAMAKGPTNGRLEFDFVDFSKASPTTQMVPRVRIASITHRVGSYIIIAGQDWDFFSPIGGVAFNYIGNYYLAGNTGFMRPQLVIMRSQAGIEYGLAVGLAAANPGQVDTDVERGKSPSYAGRLGYVGEDYRVGVSFIYSDLAFYENGRARRDAHGQNLYYEQKFSWGEIRSEVYYGQNLANLGTLSLSWGGPEENVREYGGFISGIVPLNDRHTLIGGAGIARIDNPTSLRPFLLRSDEFIEEMGIRENRLLRLGHKFLISEDLSWNSEITRFQTVIKVDQAAYRRTNAHTIETGLQLRF